MTLSSPFLLVLRVCWEHSRSLLITARQMAPPLMIGLLSQRRILMTLGAARHAWLPLRRLMNILLLLLPLLQPLSRQISLLTSRKGSRERLPCSWHWRIPSSGTHSTTLIGTLAQTWAQEVSEVLNPSFKPATGEKDLVEPSRSTCMLSLRGCCRQTKGKPCWWGPMKQMLMPKRSLLNCLRMPSDLPTLLLALQDSYPTSLLWGSEMVIGMVLLIASLEQVWLYESLVDMAAHFSPEQKMHMLQNAAHLLHELRQVKNQADQLQAFHGKTMHYDSYCNLLLSCIELWCSIHTKGESQLHHCQGTKEVCVCSWLWRWWVQWHLQSG